DFGLARFQRESLGPQRVTDDGTALGTPDYLAPEQAQDAHRVDIRADVYSLGCTLYHLLAGQVPFPGDTALQKVYGHLYEPPTPLGALRPDLPARLAGVVERMMAKDPAGRFQTPGEVAGALAPFLAGNGAQMSLPAGRWAASSAEGTG